jgi:hypothetical protein
MSFAVLSHLGSDMSAECLTRPQYVERSYCEAGRSRFPGREADILARALWSGGFCFDALGNVEEVGISEESASSLSAVVESKVR